jgi:hypothetical protein
MHDKAIFGRFNGVNKLIGLPFYLADPSHSKSKRSLFRRLELYDQDIIGVAGEDFPRVFDAAMLITDTRHGRPEVQASAIALHIHLFMAKLQSERAERLVMSLTVRCREESLPDEVFRARMIAGPNQASEPRKILQRVAWRSILTTSIPHRILIQL